jgi:hypothetical protein
MADHQPPLVRYRRYLTDSGFFLCKNGQNVVIYP